jgi:outer membrane protein OmpU
MNNFKKIGMTALAASLVSTSAFAGELTASGAASITAENYSGEQINTGVGYSMADSVVLSGSTELDNGMTVSMSFELDDADTSHSYDSHSVTIASDSLGTLTFSGNGGSSAVSAIDATAAGDIFDNFDGQTGDAETSSSVGDAAMLTSPGGDDSFYYTLPEMVEGLSVSASYNPQATTGFSSSAFGATYTGIEGLSVSYGVGDNNRDAGSTYDADVTTMKASYAYGPVTVAYSNHEYDSATATRDQDTTSFSVAYTVTDAISVSYGEETIDSGEQTVDAEYTSLSVSYTSGGMTITAKQQEAENISYSTTSTEDQDYWGLTLAFAF